MTFKYGVLVLSVAGLVNLSLAQQEQGDLELQLQGSFSSTVGADVTSSIGTIAGQFGPFITSNIQVGIGPTLTITTATFGSTVFAVYSFLFQNARTVPYVGASYYKRDFNNGNDRGWVGGNAGAKFFITKKTAVDFSANYLTSLNTDTKGGLLLFAFGLSFLL